MIMAKQKILLVIPSPIKEVGGLSTIVKCLATGLLSNYNVQLLVFDWDARMLCSSIEDNFVTHRLRLRVPCHIEKPVKNLLAWIRDFPSEFRQLLSLLRSQRFDIVHLHYASAYHYYFRLARVFSGPPYVVTLHGSDVVGFCQRSRCERKLTLWSLRGAARIITVSKSLRLIAKETFPQIHEIDYVYNGCDLASIAGQKIQILGENLKLDLPKTFFLLVANVTHCKGHDIAIKAWAKVTSRFPEMHLVIVGEPRDHWDYCINLVSKLGCKHVVHMLGALPHTQVLALMGDAYGLIAPSRYEGFGLVILEAGLNRLPVVCSNINAFLEIVEDGRNAIIIPKDNPVALATAVIHLIENAHLRQELGLALESRVKTTFSLQRMINSYEELYQHICSAL